MASADGQAAFSRLLSPARIGQLTLRNRIVLTGHGTGMGRDFKPDDRLTAYYRGRAKGGVALIMLGSQQVNPTSPGISNLLRNDDDGIMPGLRRIAEAVHGHGGLIFDYLSHRGLALSARPSPLWAASAIYDQKYGEVAHAMTGAEMAEPAAAARRNIAAGLDGIEVHCDTACCCTSSFVAPRCGLAPTLPPTMGRSATGARVGERRGFGAVGQGRARTRRRRARSSASAVWPSPTVWRRCVSFARRGSAGLDGGWIEQLRQR